jgi:CRISPR/Cas system CSM-associated protein Csm4 (group 5 of RAMP superfamily)
MFVEMSKGWKFRINQEESWKDHFREKVANIVVSSTLLDIDKKFFSPQPPQFKNQPPNNHNIDPKILIFPFVNFQTYLNIQSFVIPKLDPNRHLKY